MKQYLYTAENIEKNFWGSYTDVHLRGDELVLTNTLNDLGMVLTGEHEDLRALCVALDEGVEDDRLMMLLTNINCPTALEDLYFKGLVE